MANIKAKNEIPTKIYYPILSPRERLEVLRQIRGMWKGKQWNPIKELERMRKEWNRKIIK